MDIHVLARMTRWPAHGLDVPATLHANVKSLCAKLGVKMTDAIRELLEDKFGEAG